MSKKVKMVAKVGDQVVPCGECHPGQARVLVKEELAAWNDGKLLLIVRPALAEVIDANSSWKGPLDDGNVSDREMLRRKAWFATMVPRAAIAIADTKNPESRLPTTLETSKEMVARVKDQFTRFVQAASPTRPMDEDEVASWFEDSADTNWPGIPDNMWASRVKAWELHSSFPEPTDYTGLGCPPSLLNLELESQESETLGNLLDWRLVRPDRSAAAKGIQSHNKSENDET